ncbi:hypothetical protein VaNZ11_006167 [Volvox africanus]|uniref:Uncharacterized protein n=1 Tax=Volvox africanus TaxID=51714 RepID=A0ABQ5S191_9CHLO|nr:hypothetical protein VaNZ11_006167 [Volvox africanus]
MEDARGSWRGSTRLGNAVGSEAQQAALYSFQAAQQLDLAPGYQKGKRPKLTSLSLKSINCPPGVSPGPIPLISPRPGSNSSIGQTTVSAPHLHLPAEFSRLCLEVDGEPDKGASVLDLEASFSDSQGRFQQWDLVGAHDAGSAGTAPELPAVPALAMPAGAGHSIHRSPLRRSTLSPRTWNEEDGQQQHVLLSTGARAYTTSCEGSQEAGMPLWPKVVLTSLNRPAVGSSAAAAAAAATAAGGDHQQQQQASSRYSNGSSSNAVHNHNYSSDSNKNVNKTNRSYDGVEHQQLEQQQVGVPQPPPPADIGLHGSMFQQVRTPNNESTALIISPSQRAFRHEKVRRHTSLDLMNLPTQLLVSSSRMAPTPRKPASAVWAGQPWAQDEDMTTVHHQQLHQQQQQTSQVLQQPPPSDLPQQQAPLVTSGAGTPLPAGPAGATKSAAVAVMGAPVAASADTTTGASGSAVAGIVRHGAGAGAGSGSGSGSGAGAGAGAVRIPQPSNLYGRMSSSTLLAKLPPTRVSPRRGGLAILRRSSNGTFQDSTAQQLQLSPYTNAATGGPSGTGPLLLLDTADMDHETHLSSSAPASPVRPRSPASAVITFAGGSVSPSGIRAATVSSTNVVEGVAVTPDGSSHSNPGAFIPVQQATSQPAAEANQFAGYNPSIEQILLGSGAASSSLRSMANSSPPRPDLQLQQAFRNLSSGNKTPRLATREDVWELQAALLRQVSVLASPSPELPAIHSPRTAAGVPLPAAIIAGAGLRNSVGNIRHFRQMQQQNALLPHAGAAAAASSNRGTLAVEGSHRVSTSPDISRRTTADGGPYPEISLPTIINVTSTSAASHSRWATQQPAQPSPVAVVLVGPPVGVAPFTSDDVAFLPLLTRDDEGYVLESLIAGQECALSTALTGIVAQVGVSCVERAHLLHRLWATMRQILAAVLRDRETARSQAAAASREASDCASRAAGEVGSLQQQLASLTQGLEDLTAKDREQTAELVAANKELEHLRQVVTACNVESLSARLVDAAEGRRRAVAEAARLQGQVKALEAEIHELRQEQAMAAARLTACESHTCALTAELRCRTPRPSRSLGILDELLTEHGSHKEAVLAALSTGADPTDLHRLMLGVTHDGEDLSRWVEVFGCVQSVIPPWGDAATHRAAMAPPQDTAVTEAANDNAASVAAMASAAVAGSGGGIAVTASNLGVTSPGTVGIVSPPSCLHGSIPSGAGGTGAAPQTQLAGALGQGVPGGTPPPVRRGVSFSQQVAATAAALAAAVTTGSRVTSGCNSPDWEHLSTPALEPPLAAGSGTGESAAAQAVGGSTLLEASSAGLLARGVNAARHRRRSSAVSESFGGGAGVGGGESAARRQVMSPPQQQAYMKRQHAWLVSAMEVGDVASLRRLFPDEAVDAIGSGLQLGVSSGGMAAWLLGTLSPGGFNFMPYKDLVGVLSRQFQHTPLDLGGPITSGLELAALSTVQRMKVLEDKVQQLHREAVRLKRCLADRKRAERAQVQAEANANERKAHDRPVHPVHTFLTAKWGDFFDGLGCGAKVPKVLHAEGRVFNSRLEKVDAEKLVNSIWAAKADWQSRNPGSQMSLADFMMSYMQRKYVNPRALTETAYTLIYTLGQHMYDPDCHIFIRVLLGEVDEGIRAEGEELQADLVEVFSCLDRVAHGRCTGYVPKRDMHTALKGFFPSKSRARFREVLEALDADCPDSEAVRYRRIFDTDQDLNQGVFAETIRTQHLEERLERLQAIEDALMGAVDKARVHHVPPSLLASVLKLAIPDCAEESVRQYLRLVYGSDAGIRAAEAAAPAANAKFRRAFESSNSSGKGGPNSKGGGSAQGSRSSAAGNPRQGAAPMTTTAASAAGSGTMGAEGAADTGSSPTGSGVGSGSESNGKHEEQVVVIPTAEAVVQLIRLSGWVPQLPADITPLVERLGENNRSLAGSCWSASSPGSWGSSEPATMASTSPRGAGGYSSGGAGANGPKLASWTGNSRAALKRLRYVQAMGALKEAWLREEQARVQHIVQLAHGGGAGAHCLPLMRGPAAPAAEHHNEAGLRGSNSGVAGVPSPEQPIDTDDTGAAAHATLAAAAATVGVKISSLASLPTADEFVDSKEPDVAALEAARKVLSAQFFAATAAMSKNAGSINTTGSPNANNSNGTGTTAGNDGAAKADLSLPNRRLARASGSASNNAAGAISATGGNISSRSPSPACGAATSATAAIAALEEVGERLQRLWALGGTMAALAEERNETFTLGRVPDVHRNVDTGDEPLDGSTGTRNVKHGAAAAGGARMAQ